MNWLGQVCVLIAGVVTVLLLFSVTQSALRAYLGAHHQMAEQDLAALFVVTSGTRIAVLTALLMAAAAAIVWLMGGGLAAVVITSVACLLVPRWAINRLRARRLQQDRRAAARCACILGGSVAIRTGPASRTRSACRASGEPAR